MLRKSLNKFNLFLFLFLFYYNTTREDYTKIYKMAEDETKEEETTETPAEDAEGSSEDKAEAKTE